MKFNGKLMKSETSSSLLTRSTSIIVVNSFPDSLGSEKFIERKLQLVAIAIYLVLMFLKTQQSHLMQEYSIHTLFDLKNFIAFLIR